MGPLVAHAAAGGARLRGRGAAAAGAVGAAGVPRGLAARVRGHLLDDGVVLLELVADAHNHHLLEHLQPSVAVRSSAARLTFSDEARSAATDSLSSSISRSASSAE